MHTIDIVSDVSCPWCVIGYRSLQAAIVELEMEDAVALHWRPFELNPGMGPQGQDRVEHIQQKYGLSPEQSRANRQNLIERGLAVGYEFDFIEGGRIYNTFNAHRLLHWARQFGLQTALKLALFNLYFQQAGNPSDEQQLINCVELVGLPIAGAKEVLGTDLYAEEVRADQAWAQRQGISAVPTFIFDHKYLLSGAQPMDVFINVFEELKKDLSEESA